MTAVRCVKGPTWRRTTTPTTRVSGDSTRPMIRATGPEWEPIGRPEYLRQQVELSLRHLGVERIDLLQLHRIDAQVPLADQLGALVRLQQEGKIRHIGLSEVTVEQLVQAREIAEIASVQNKYNLADRSSEDVLEYAERENIAFIPWYPMATGELARPGGPLAPPPILPARCRTPPKAPPTPRRAVGGGPAGHGPSPSSSPCSSPRARSR